MLNEVVYFQTPAACLGPLLGVGENANVASEWTVPVQSLFRCIICSDSPGIPPRSLTPFPL